MSEGTQGVGGPAAQEVELNSAEWLTLQGRLPWVEFHDEGDVFWLFGGDTWPRSTVALARFTPGRAHRRAGEILERHWEHRVACNWIVGPVTQPADLSRHLRAHGFSCRIHCAGMACDLDRLGTPLAAPPGVVIELTDAPPSLVPLTTPRRKRRHEGIGILAKLAPRRVWHFSAMVDGVPVGETALFEGASSAGIYNVEVKEAFRRRGIGSALIDAALRQSKKLGRNLAVLGATGMGQTVYERLGFREVCRISFWKYGKMRQLRFSGRP